MRLKEINLNELRGYAKNHTVFEISEHFGRKQINGINRLLKTNNIAYKKGEAISEDEQAELMNEMKHIRIKTADDGLKKLAYGVLLMAKIDGDENFPTKELFEGAVRCKKESVKTYEMPEKIEVE